MGEFISKPPTTGPEHTCSLPGGSILGDCWWQNDYAYASDAHGAIYACDCGKEYKWLPRYQTAKSLSLYVWREYKDDISKRQRNAYEDARKDLEVSNNTRKSRGFWDFLFKGEK